MKKQDNNNEKFNNTWSPRDYSRWGPCAVAFYWEGAEEDLVDDIYYEPGFYAWKTTERLNWETMAPVFISVRLIKAAGNLLKEDGTPKQPEQYLLCDKGVVVRQIRLKHENGRERPPFVNKDEYVFIIKAENGVLMRSTNSSLKLTLNEEMGE